MTTENLDDDDNQEIHINIWDDFHDDGYVPDGETQETFAYLEGSLKGKDDDCKKVLELLKANVEALAKPEWNLVLYVSYYDSSKIYPNLIGTEHEWCLYKRWQLEMKNITHKALDYLVENLQKQQLKYNGIPLNIYSES